MNTTTFSTVAGVCCLLATGCGQRQGVTVADFPGSYVARYSHGVETLVLRENGTYLQSYVSNGTANTQTNTGQWQFHAAPASFVHLKDALRFDDKQQNAPIATDLGLNVKTWRDGRIELVISEEEGLSYKMQKKPSTGNSVE